VEREGRRSRLGREGVYGVKIGESETDAAFTVLPLMTPSRRYDMLRTR